MSSWPIDLHLAPLYLKWSNECFTHNRDSDGMHFFKAAEQAQKGLAHRVYEQMWKIKNCPQGDPEYGRKCFHNAANLSSFPHEKCQAIERVLGEIVSSDNEGTRAANELRMRANQAHRWLWIIHGRPNGDPKYGRHAFYGEQGKSSNVEERLLAARKYADESRTLTWLTGDKEIRLIRRADGGLEFIIVDQATGNVTCNAVDLRNRDINDAISRWSACELGADNGVVTPRALSCCEEFPEPVADTLQLLWRGRELVWRIYHTATKTLSFMLADIHTKVLRVRIRALPIDSRISFLRDFLFQYQLNAHHKLLSVSVLKKTFLSQLSSNVFIDRDAWAVTLISGGPSSIGLPLMSRFGHAMIAYEGVENGNRFLKRIHLTTNPENSLHPTRRSNEAEIEFRDGSPRPDCLRTPTWQRSREQIESMIEWCHRQNQRPVPFNPGGHPWFNPSFWSAMGSLVLPLLHRNDTTVNPIRAEHNCLTLCISALGQADINLPVPAGLVAEPNAYIEAIVNNPEVVRLE